MDAEPPQLDPVAEQFAYLVTAYSALRAAGPIGLLVFLNNMHVLITLGDRKHIPVTFFPPTRNHNTSH